MFKITMSKELDYVNASRLYNRARRMLSGWVFIKPSNDGYTVMYVAKQGRNSAGQDFPEINASSVIREDRKSKDKTTTLGFASLRYVVQVQNIVVRRVRLNLRCTALKMPENRHEFCFVYLGAVRFDILSWYKHLLEQQTFFVDKNSLEHTGHSCNIGGI